MIHVKKRDGRSEIFQPEKIQFSVIYAGGSVDDAKLIAEKIDSIAYDGITTDEIARQVRKWLRNINPDAARNYEKYYRDFKQVERPDGKD